jgi:hypothetical protein
MDPTIARTESTEPQPGQAAAAVDELEARTNWRQAHLGVAPAVDEPQLKTHNSVWQTLWQTRLPALEHATGEVLYPA